MTGPLAAVLRGDDLFRPGGVSDMAIARTFDAMVGCPATTFQVVTRHPERMHGLLTRWAEWDRRSPDAPDLMPLPNVWFGVYAEDQAAAEARVPVLLNTPAALRFVACGPLLGPVDLRDSWLYRPLLITPMGGYDNAILGPCIDWITISGESGPEARPMDLAWARALIRQGRGAGVPVFVEQLGSRPSVSGHDNAFWNGPIGLRDPHGSDMAEWPEDLRVREFPKERM